MCRLPYTAFREQEADNLNRWREVGGLTDGFRPDNHTFGVDVVVFFVLPESARVGLAKLSAAVGRAMPGCLTCTSSSLHIPICARRISGVNLPSAGRTAATVHGLLVQALRPAPGRPWIRIHGLSVTRSSVLAQIDYDETLYGVRTAVIDALFSGAAGYFTPGWNVTVRLMDARSAVNEASPAVTAFCV